MEGGRDWEHEVRYFMMFIRMFTLVLEFKKREVMLTVPLMHCMHLSRIYCLIKAEIVEKIVRRIRPGLTMQYSNRSSFSTSQSNGNKSVLSEGCRSFILVRCYSYWSDWS